MRTTYQTTVSFGIRLALLSLFLVIATYGQATPTMAVYVSGLNSVNENRQIGKQTVQLINSRGEYDVIERTGGFSQKIEEQGVAYVVHDGMLQEIGKHFEADAICVVKIQPVGSVYALQARLLDVSAGEETARSTASFRSLSDSRGLSAATEVLVWGLFAEQQPQKKTVKKQEKPAPAALPEPIYVKAPISQTQITTNTSQVEPSPAPTASAQPATPSASTSAVAAPQGYQAPAQPYQAPAMYIPRKEPALACLLSLVLPGGGQYYNQEYSKGALMTGMYVISLSGLALSEPGSGSSAVFTVGVLGTVLWSLIDAPVSATRINKANGYLSFKLGQKAQLSLQPDMRFASSGIVASDPTAVCGMSMQLRF